MKRELSFTALRRIAFLGILGSILCALVVLPTSARADVETPGTDPDRPWVAQADALLAAYVALSSEHGEDAGLWTRIAFTRLQLGRVGTAIEAAIRAHELAPADVETILILAQCEAVAGDTESAAATLQRGLELHPGDAALMESVAAIFIALERWPEAVGVLRELIRKNPNDPGYYMDLGRILLTQGDYGGAVAAFGQARAVGEDPALSLALTGKAHLAAGEWDQAMAEFEQSITLRPNADALGGRATIHYLRGDAPAAVSDFRQAIELAPRDPDLQFNLGNMLVQVGDGEGAERAYRASLRMDPGSAEAQLNLGILLLNRFEIDEAQQHLRLATQADPSIAPPWLHLARIAGARFEFAESRRIYALYHARVDDPEERRRIEVVMERIDEQIEASRAAIERGEIHILQARMADEATAEELIQRVRRGKDFFLLATEYSDLGERGGVDAGFMDPDTVLEGFRDVISPLAIGEMTPPVELEGGWFVFMRVE
jgi:Flp pilus assembly protein TadD